MKTKICGKCGTEKNVNDFYHYSGRSRCWCKECDKKNTIIRQTIFKALCVEYKGGKCEKCGYDEYIGALEFHHKDPSQKKFGISRAKLRKFDQKIIEELDKCDMLCANCHRVAHNLHDIESLEEIWKKYKEIQEQNKKNSQVISEQRAVCNCGNPKSKQAKQCSNCRNKKALKRNIDEVIAKVKETNWTQAAKHFDISDNALRKFVRKNGIDPNSLKEKQ